MLKVQNVNDIIIKKLKVIQIIDSLAVGGAEMMAVNIANSLSKNGIESYLCATRNEGGLKSKLNNEVGYLFLNRNRTIDVLAILKLNKFIKSKKIEVIHAHSSSYFIATLIGMMNPKLKLIWHDHFGGSEAVSERKLQALRFCSNYFNTIISVNKKLKNWSKKNLKTKQVYYLPNFASLKDSDAKIILKGIDGKRIVCLAGFRPQKDHLNLLKAFRIISKNSTDWTLHLVGNHNNDVYFKEIKQFINTNNLSEVVFLYHNAIDVKNILSQATIGVLSSNSEGLPVALLEYGLSKLPVVVTDVGECVSVVGNGDFGFVVPSENENILAQKIKKLILDKKLRMEYGINFYNHINENYSEQKIIHKLLQIYAS